MVMVNKSLDAANAIIAGNSVNLTRSAAIMLMAATKLMARAGSYTRGSCCSVSATREAFHAESLGARKRFDARNAEMDRSASEREGNADPAWSLISSPSIPSEGGVEGRAQTCDSNDNCD
jgi:hypothetical protein